MKSVFYFLGGLLFLVSCQPQPQISEKQANQVMKEIKEIPLNYEKVVDGKIALTRNFYFIFDQSGSMGEECSGQKKIDGAKGAISKFMKSVPDDINIGLMAIGCGSSICELLPLGTATPAYKKQFEEYIMSMDPNGNTPLVQGIKIAVDRMVVQKKKQLGYGDYRIIVITDGEATDGYIQEAAVYATQYAMGIYTIGLCIDESHPLYQFSVKYYDAKDYDQLQNALKSVTAETEMFDASTYDSTAYKKTQ